MNIESLKEKIKIAKEAVETFEEPYKSIAFKEILNKLLEEKPVLTPISAESKTELSREIEVEKSLNEFFNELKPKGHPNIILAFAYYYYKYGESPIFNVDDIEKTYTKLLISKSKNPSDIINWNRRKGYVMWLDELKDGKKAFQITQSGIRFVETKFEKGE